MLEWGFLGLKNVVNGELGAPNHKVKGGQNRMESFALTVGSYRSPLVT